MFIHCVCSIFFLIIVSFAPTILFQVLNLKKKLMEVTKERDSLSSRCESLEKDKIGLNGTVLLYTSQVIIKIPSIVF